MKTSKHSVQLFALFALTQLPALGQSNFLVTPSLGFQVSFPGQESYQYQVSCSTNLTDWFPVTGLEVSCGGTETFSFGMTNGPHASYRAEEFPPNLTNHIVGLTNVFFDNAAFQGQGASMTASGFRAQSRDYNTNDYLTAQFQFDLCKQAFSMTSLQVFTNVGVICGQTPSYFIKDATNQLVLTSELTGTTLTPDANHTITSTGQVMTVHLGVAQVFEVVVVAPAHTNHIVITNPNGQVLVYDTFEPTSGTLYSSGYGGLVAGTYSLQFIPLGVSSESIDLRFHNDNGHQSRTCTNGTFFSTTLVDYSRDYDKFQVALTAGQTLRLAAPGTGANLSIYNSRGVGVYGRTGTIAAIFSVPATDTYYVIYWRSDYGGTHVYSTAVSITP